MNRESAKMNQAVVFRKMLKEETKNIFSRYAGENIVIFAGG